MRLQVSAGSFKHSQYVTGCGWVGNELYTCSDDKTVQKISSDGDDQGKVADLVSCPTDLHWFPSGEGRPRTGPDRTESSARLQLLLSDCPTHRIATRVGSK